MPAYAFISAVQVQKLGATPEKLKPDAVLSYAQSEQVMSDALSSVGRGEGAAAGVSAFEDALAAGLWRLAAQCYGWGVLASLTPCVYPMIPTTVHT